MSPPGPMFYSSQISGSFVATYCCIQGDDGPPSGAGNMDGDGNGSSTALNLLGFESVAEFIEWTLTAPPETVFEVAQQLYEILLDLE